MSKSRNPEIPKQTPEPRDCERVLGDALGLGELQAKAFAARLTVDERKQIVEVGLKDDYGPGLRKILDAAADRQNAEDREAEVSDQGSVISDQVTGASDPQIPKSLNP